MKQHLTVSVSLNLLRQKSKFSKMERRANKVYLNTCVCFSAPQHFWINMPEDVFRDTWVRYLGYANEVGESFRFMVPYRVVKWSYQLAFAYVLADTLDKTVKMQRKGGRAEQVAIAAGDCLIWQTLASVLIPGLVINRLCAFTMYALNCKMTFVPSKMRRLVVAGVGLGSIPLIVQPIDKGVDVFMDNTYRKIFTAN